MGEAPPQEGDGVVQIRKTTFDGFKGAGGPSLIQTYNFSGVKRGQQGKQTDRMIATDN